MSSTRKQDSYLFSNGIDHRIVSVVKAVDQLNAAFGKFIETISRTDSLVLLKFNKDELKFEAETSFKVPVLESNTLQESDFIKGLRPEVQGYVKPEFTLPGVLSDYLGVLTQDIGDDGKKVRSIKDISEVADVGEKTLKFNDLSQEDGHLTRFFIDKDFIMANRDAIESYLTFSTDIHNYSNYVVKEKDESGKAREISKNLISNLNIILKEWLDLSRENLEKEKKELYLHTMEGMRLFYLARATEDCYPAANLDDFLNPSTGGFQAFTLGDLVDQSHIGSINPVGWKILKPLFTQYLIKQTGPALAGSLRSFWKPSEVEKLKAEAVSSFETKPQNKGNLGGSKQKKGPKPGPKEGKTKAKDKGKKAGGKNQKPAKRASKKQGAKKQ